MTERKEYVCDQCKRRLVSHTPEAEVDEEARTLWGAVPEGDDRATLCDDCFKEFIQYLATRQGEAS